MSRSRSRDTSKLFTPQTRGIDLSNEQRTKVVRRRVRPQCVWLTSWHTHTHPYITITLPRSPLYGVRVKIHVWNWYAHVHLCFGNNFKSMHILRCYWKAFPYNTTVLSTLNSLTNEENVLLKSLEEENESHEIHSIFNHTIVLRSRKLPMRQNNYFSLPA